MSQSNYAVIHKKTGIVENVVIWDGVTLWSPPNGFIAVLNDVGAAIGWTYKDGAFSAPPAAEEE
jgi:Na+-transporting NADH:ubiquinone oxidoreductase subunit NqrC